MTIEKREEIISLYDVYGKLLTDKQQAYFENYYFDDLSITEIASNFDISRNAVFDQLKRVIQILEDYEVKLKILNKTKRIKDLDLPTEVKQEIMDILKE
ncbi:MAG TPA: hypothetical protein PKV66_05865 [Candidatus Pelethenecus sp.]|nr:hypothetical protein [Candidatus Pelethenecus sp.]